ncbi:MAG TPA: ABC transporter permease [Anaerolineales bacterium]|nr:ABC transporter permease [Anaerolineales bacterium]
MNSTSVDSLSTASILHYGKRLARLLLPVFLSMIAGALLILAAGKNPLLAYTSLFDAGFSCDSGPGRCAVVTALQFATPLILSGLSALVALRGGFFSVGQLGQMLFGAAAANWLAGNLSLPGIVHPVVALSGAALLGGLWGLIPALLKHYIGVNEIIATLVLNPIATVLVGWVRLPRVEASARLFPLIPSTKLTAGIFIALLAAWLIYVFLWHTPRGLEIRTNAGAPRFALYGGMPVHGPVLLAMALSGSLAGLAGGVEVLGVHYHFVSNFSAVNDFDGLIVAFAGRLHPAGVVLYAFLLGGLRTGSLVGLQIGSGIPRELGSTLIALILLFTATNRSFASTGGEESTPPRVIPAS